MNVLVFGVWFEDKGIESSLERNIPLYSRTSPSPGKRVTRPSLLHAVLRHLPASRLVHRGGGPLAAAMAGPGRTPWVKWPGGPLTRPPA